MKEKRKKQSRDIIVTKFGVAYKNMNLFQRRSLNELLFSATDPSGHSQLPGSVLRNDHSFSRKFPDYEAKNDHLWIKEIKIKKDLESGKWEIGEIDTNHGRFATGPEQTLRIKQELVGALVTHLRQDVFEDDLKTFLAEEINDKDQENEKS